MKHLSLLSALMLTSSLVCAGWTRYLDGGGTIPKGDCLEMFCEYGCMEDDSGNGQCCPSDGSKGSNCNLNECCQEGLVCQNGKCVVDCPTIDLFSFYEFAQPADRDVGVFDVSKGTIGPYECDYKVVMPWWSVDDNVCIQGDNIACQERNDVLSKWHVVGVGLDTSQHPNNRFSLTEPEVAYYLPAGKQISLKMINKQNGLSGTDSGLKASIRLEPITDQNKTERCGGGWFTSISSGKCSDIACGNQEKLSDGTTCCVDPGANKIVTQGGSQICCPIGRYEKITSKIYSNGTETTETTERCCPVGQYATDSGCCPIKDFYKENDQPKCLRNCPAGTFWNLLANRCTECLSPYGSGKTGACATTQKPLCNISTWNCEPCPTDYVWSSDLMQCMSKTYSCFKTDVMKCNSGKILSVDGTTTYYEIPNPNKNYYMNIRTMYKDVSSSEVDIKHLHVGNATTNWDIDLKDENTWSTWKNIQLYKGPETGNNGTPSWKSSSVSAPVPGASMWSNQCSADSKDTTFTATVCVEWEFSNTKFNN